MMMEKPIVSRPARWWDLPAVLLLVVILTTAFSRLITTKWADNLDVVRIITYLGLVLGLALGYSRFSPRLVSLFGLAYGVFIIPWRLALTMNPEIPWIERLHSLAGRLGMIINYLIQQKAVPDNLLFVTLMCVLFWFIGLHAGYTLIRYANPWTIVLPSGLAIVLIHAYDTIPSSRIWFLIIYLFLALLMVARLVYISQRRRWETNRTYMPSYLGTDIIRFALVACLLLVALSWSTPVLARALPAAKNSWDRVVTPWWNDLRNVFENAFASLRSSVGFASEYYGPNLSLGRGNVLSDATIFTVQAPKNPPEGIRFYWRARVYDTYDGGWISSLQTTRALDARDITLKFPDMADNPAGEYAFTFYLNKSLTTLLAPNQPVWLSRPSRAEFAYNPDGSVDLGTLRASPTLRSGEIYSVRSSFNVVTVEDLQKAGLEYPNWVTARYLQLPPSITLRTRQLAARIAEGKETPSDIADAVTQYLRSNYQYTETIPPLPTDQEPIDWFLFDLKTGFCNYYASAEVILLRAAGVPARLAVGYASGDNIDNPEFFTVRQRDAHAWPEVYFPGIGWEEFEPTVSQPPISRPTTALNAENQNPSFPPGLGPNDLEPEPPFPRNTTGDLDANAALWQSRLTILITVAISLILLALLVPLARRKQLHKKVPLVPIILEKVMLRAGLRPPRFLQNLALMASLSPLERAYQQINLALARLGKRPASTQTPAERVETLAYKLPPAQEPARVVLFEYHREKYSSKGSTDHSSAQRAGEEIRRLSLRAQIRRRFGI